MEQFTTIRLKYKYNEAIGNEIDKFCRRIVDSCISLDVLDGINRTEWKNEAEYEEPLVKVK